MAWPNGPAGTAGLLGCRKEGDVKVKLITAIVRPERLDDVARAVTDAGARGLTMTEVRGFGQQYGHMVAVHPDERQMLARRKLRIDVVVQDEVADAVLEAIAKSVNTGAIGDGKIWVCPVDSALRVRTGERDAKAV